MQSLGEVFTESCCHHDRVCYYVMQPCCLFLFKDKVIFWEFNLKDEYPQLFEIQYS